jgi:hypothetical protein
VAGDAAAVHKVGGAGEAMTGPLVTPEIDWPMSAAPSSLLLPASQAYHLTAFGRWLGYTSLQINGPANSPLGYRFTEVNSHLGVSGEGHFFNTLAVYGDGAGGCAVFANGPGAGVANGNGNRTFVAGVDCETGTILAGSGSRFAPAFGAYRAANPSSTIDQLGVMQDPLHGLGMFFTNETTTTPEIHFTLYANDTMRLTGTQFSPMVGGAISLGSSAIRYGNIWSSGTVTATALSAASAIVSGDVTAANITLSSGVLNTPAATALQLSPTTNLLLQSGTNTIVIQQAGGTTAGGILAWPGFGTYFCGHSTLAGGACVGLGTGAAGSVERRTPVTSASGLAEYLVEGGVITQATNGKGLDARAKRQANCAANAVSIDLDAPVINIFTGGDFCAVTLTATSAAAVAAATGNTSMTADVVLVLQDAMGAGDTVTFAGAAYEAPATPCVLGLNRGGTHSVHYDAAVGKIWSTGCVTR